VILRSLLPTDEQNAILAHHELALDNFEFLLGYEEGMNWSAYLQILENESLNLDLPEGRVQATFLVAEREGVIVGRSSIRHLLNEFLFNYAGHIGYGVRPRFRKQGVATEIMRQSLEIIHALGVTDVLMTCNDDNLGSAKIIEFHGGVLENKVNFQEVLKRRYWIR
jgi:predicted acetyltransferase